MTEPPLLDRASVLAYRAHAHGLGRAAGAARDLPGLALGVQDTPPGAARLAIAARTRADGAEPAHWEGDRTLTAVWSLRGAPHLHRRADLAALSEALWPLDDADAAARLAWNAGRVKESGLPPLHALELTAAAVAEVASADPAELDATGLAPVERADGELGLSKGLLSREVTRRLPESLHRWCEPCQVAHLSEQLLRLAALPGGLLLDGGAPVVLAPVPSWPGVPKAPAGTEALVRGYLHLYAPATPADVKAFLGCSTEVVRRNWPTDAVEVRLAGRRPWALADDVAALTDPPKPPRVRLLPSNDAFLKAGDRDVLVPDRAEQKAIWRVLGSPGVLLLDGVPGGVWRPKVAGKRLTLAIEPFAPLPAAIRRELDAEAARVAAVRGLPLAGVTI